MGNMITGLFLLTEVLPDAYTCSFKEASKPRIIAVIENDAFGYDPSFQRDGHLNTIMFP